MSDPSLPARDRLADPARPALGALVGRFLSSASTAAIAAAVARATGFLVFALVARRLDQGQADAYALAVSYLTLFLPFSTLGLSDPITRDVARDRSLAGAYLLNLGLFRLASAWVCYGLLAVVAVTWFDYPVSTTRLVLWMGACLIPESLVLLLRAVFTALERQDVNALVAIVVSVANLGFAWWALRSGVDPIWLAGARLGSGLLGLIVGAVLAAVVVPAAWWRSLPKRPDRSWIRAMLCSSWPFTVMVVLYAVEWRADLLILSAWSGEGQVARYYGAQLFLLSFLMLLDAYRLAALPLFSRLVQQGSKELGFLHDRSFWYLALIIVPISFGVSVLAKDLLALFNPDYAAASSTLTLLMVALIVSALNEPNGVLMIAAGQQRTLAALFGISLAVNVVANVVLDRFLGGMGAAIARVLSVTAFSAVNALFVRRRIGRRFSLLKLPRVVLAGACMGGVLLALQAIVPWWLAGMLAGVVYLVALLVLKGVPTDDLTVIWKHVILQERH